ncbi:MAG: hybrid sensor histidine kinase/response regulator [Eubacteriales bacterium]|nr:hybrid sensor histidine kinase/response regulator [Eubacteriales bacterium]
MDLLEIDALDNLIHSSSISKGIERTMEHIINELELNSMYILHYENGMESPQIAYDWELESETRNIDFQSYVNYLEEWYHFEEQDFFYAYKVTGLSKEEAKFYKKCKYKSIVEYRMLNHGNHVGYILLGWEQPKKLTDEEEKSLHILLKLMNESLVKQFYDELIGVNDWQLFKLASTMTKTMFYLIDDNFQIQYVNNYVKDLYPDIKMGDYCYSALCGTNAPCKDCPLRQMEESNEIESMQTHRYFPYLQDTFWVNYLRVTMSGNRLGYAVALQKSDVLQSVEKRGALGRKFIFALSQLYKDIIVVEVRKDIFYNLLKQERENEFSYSMDFVLKWLSKLHLEDKQKFIEFFDVNFLQNDYIKGVKRKELDFRYRTHQGEYHCMNAQVIFEYSIKKEAMAYILLTDVEQVRSAHIEEQRRMRDSLMAARSSAELKGELLRNLSHDIRTPMSSILSMTSVAKQVHTQEDKLLDCLSNIDAYAEHMIQTMDSLLDMVKIDDSVIEISSQPLDMEQFLKRIDMSVQNIAESVEFQTINQCRYNQLAGDEVRLYQALMTLIKNALSYTPKSGSVQLTVKQIAADAKNAFTRFELEDTGNGLSDRMKETVFGFHHNVDEGLIDDDCFDLSLAANIIRLMGGEIAVATSAKGTRLDFTIPLAIHEAEKAKVEKKTETFDAEVFKGKRALLAEDSEMGQDALRAVLEVVGFTVDTVDNGKKAVINFVSQPAYTYDIILMDIHMPYMGGREATKCIRISGKEDGESVPIIGLMANTFNEDVKESIESGMQDHLTKPVDVDHLYKVLQKELSKRTQKEEEQS